MSDTPTPTSATDIGERIRQALDGTTPGPWQWWSNDDDPEDVAGVLSSGVHVIASAAWCNDSTADISIENPADRDMIAAAPQLLADALAVIEAQERTIADLKGLLREHTDNEKCSFDHHGYCQTHGDFGIEPGDICYMERSRRAVGESENP